MGLRGNDVYGCGRGGLARHDFEFFRHLLRDQAINDCASADSKGKLASPNQCSFAGTSRYVQNIRRTELHIFRLEFHYFLKVDLNLMLLAIGISSDNYGMARFRRTIHAARERKKLERGELTTIVRHRVAARPANCPECVNDACVWNSYNISGKQNYVVL